MDKFTMFADGGSRGNPGPAGSGSVIFIGEGVERGLEEIGRASRYLGIATNNVAEYTAIIIGLEKALELGVVALTVKLDSQLAVRQINGQYKVKSLGLKPLHAQVKEHAVKFNCITFEHVYREQNTVADSIVNECIDEALRL